MSNVESPGDGVRDAAVEPVRGLTNPRVLSFERFPIRTRGGSSTQSAWRLSVVSREGQGTLVLVEVSTEETFFRGEGIFLGWSPERLEAAYRALLPEPEEPAFELPQLG
jgi:hypothetical protein